MLTSFVTISLDLSFKVPIREYTYIYQQVLNQLIQDEQLISSEVHKIIEHYIFSEKKPLRDDIVWALEIKSTILQRTPIITRVTDKLMKFIEVFIDNI